MAEFPALPLWTDAYLGDTTHLTTIEHGAYLLLLMAMWRNNGSLPNDSKMLARYARMTGGQWSRASSTIMQFFKIEGDSISQLRMTDELNHVRQHSRKQSNNAKARWLKVNNSPNAMAMPSECQTDAPTPTPTPISKREAKASQKNTRGSRLPVDWVLPSTWGQWALSEGFSEAQIRDQSDRFRDYWVSKAGAGGSKLDWQATWRNWMRNALPQTKLKAITGGRNDKPNKEQQRMDAFIRGAQISS